MNAPRHPGARNPCKGIDIEETVGVVARSSKMKNLISMARRVANVDATVLITGESGVGKERIATLLHVASSRASCPFISVNCAAISETLLESELFGHARGAFTGAVSTRPGLFESAQRGTLLLDEIGEISPGMQVKLLRVLQEREIRRVGENVIRPVDVRIIAATNRDLASAVASGFFRQDLYYRLNVIELQVPPLRDRVADILPLAHGFLTAASQKMNRDITGFHPDAIRLLLRYQWPGNVRELENIIERAVLFSQNNPVSSSDLPTEIRSTTSAVEPIEIAARSLYEVERKHILTVLAANNGNQARTAEQLGIGTATLYRKLKKYNHRTQRQ
jgi:two-component system, NtrC family, response regulator HydG